MTVTGLSSSPLPSAKLGYDTYTGTFRLLQKDWVTQVKADLGIAQPSCFDLLRTAQRQSLVFIDSSHPRKTVLSWDLVKLVDSIGDSIEKQNPMRGERLRGPLGWWPEWEDIEEPLFTNNILINDGGEWETVTDRFLERYRQSRNELETRNAFGRTGRPLRLTGIAMVLDQLVTNTGFKELVRMTERVYRADPFGTIDSLEGNRYSILVGSLEERTRLYESAGEQPPPSTDDTGLRVPDWVLKQERDREILSSQVGP